MGYLVLSRHQGESVILEHPAGRITVTVATIDKRGQVRLAFDAPSEVQIFRSEIAPKSDAELPTLRSLRGLLKEPPGIAQEPQE